MKTLFSLLFTAFILFIFSCNQSSHKTSKGEDQKLEMPPPPALPGNKTQAMELLKKSESTDGIALQGSPGQNPDWDKKIIKTAFLKLEVKDFKSYSDIVHKAANQYGGYVSNEEQTQSSEKKESTISIKVPVDQFESIMVQLPNSASSK